jgi:hypothetical protein
MIISTRVSDPDSNNTYSRLAQIPTKHFADVISVNLTDVRRDGYRLPFFTQIVSQDRTHLPEYYNPEYGVTIDHGTVGTLFHGLSGNVFTTLIEPYFRHRQGRDGRCLDIIYKSRLRIAGPRS